MNGDDDNDWVSTPSIAFVEGGAPGEALLHRVSVLELADEDALVRASYDWLLKGKSPLAAAAPRRNRPRAQAPGRERVGAAEAAAITGMPMRSVQALAAEGRIPGAARLGGRWKFDEARLRAWLDEKEGETACRTKPPRAGPPPAQAAAPAASQITTSRRSTRPSGGKPTGRNSAGAEESTESRYARLTGRKPTSA